MFFVGFRRNEELSFVTYHLWSRISAMFPSPTTKFGGDIQRRPTLRTTSTYGAYPVSLRLDSFRLVFSQIKYFLSNSSQTNVNSPKTPYTASTFAEKSEQGLSNLQPGLVFSIKTYFIYKQETPKIFVGMNLALKALNTPSFGIYITTRLPS